MRAWFNMVQTANTDLAKSKLELTRDSILVIVKNNSVSVREDLSEEELTKFANQSYIDHLARKKMDMSVTHKTQDDLFREAQARKPDWSKGTRKETAMSITVGINEATESKVEKVKEEEEEEIIADFEPLFDF